VCFFKLNTKTDYSIVAIALAWAKNSDGIISVNTASVFLEYSYNKNIFAIVLILGPRITDYLLYCCNRLGFSPLRARLYVGPQHLCRCAAEGGHLEVLR
jgi:hypothetical protein